MVARVDIEAGVSEESDESEVELVGELDSETGGGAYSGKNGDAGHNGFLDQFETRATAHEKERLVHWGAILKVAADEFIERVMTANVLAHGEQAPVEREQRRGVESASESEVVLVSAKLVGELIEDAGIDMDAVLETAAERGDADRVE